MKYLVALMLSLLVVASYLQASGANRTHASGKVRPGISGRITDPNGAVVPGARITVSRSTQTIASRKSNWEGAYAIDLEPDTYDVTVEAAGFKKATRKSVRVGRKMRPHIDFVLEIAPVGSPRLITPNEVTRAIR